MSKRFSEQYENDIDQVMIAFPRSQGSYQTMLKQKKLEMATFSCATYLKALLHETHLKDCYTVLISTLVLKYKLNNGVINCLLDYVYFKNDQRLTINYILKIASSLAKRNIETVSGAMLYLKQSYKYAEQKPFSNYE